jgi:hypothetical protein
MTILISTDQISNILFSTHRTQANMKPTPQDRASKPFYDMLQRRKKAVGFTGDKKEVKLKTRSNLKVTAWRGKDTFSATPNRSGINTEHAYYNLVMAVEIEHDEYKQHGFTIIPNGQGTPQSRLSEMTRGDAKRLIHKVREDLDDAQWAWRDDHDALLHRQGSNDNEPVGLNAILPINPFAGNYAGHDRSSQVILQSPVAVGLTSGAGGTLRQGMQRVMKDTALYTGKTGIKGKTSIGLCGWYFIERYEAWLVNNGLSFNTEAAKAGKIDVGFTGHSYKGVKLIHDPTLDQMDDRFSAEQGLPGQTVVTATFSGGSATRQAKGVVYIASDGTVAGIAITDRGEGYTSAPTITFATSGGGSGAVASATVYSASSGGGLSQVEGDDVRIGQLAEITVSNAGSGYPVPDLVPFTNRCYLLNEQTWHFECQPGLDEITTMPADPSNQRISQFHIDGTYRIYNDGLRANGIVAAA